jgi:hypothetical protein
MNQSLLARIVLGDGNSFLDIGCSSPYQSVCFPLLDYGWDGIFVDIDWFDGWSDYNFHQIDATKTDWKFVKDNPDYVSIDVEGDGDRFKVLQGLNWEWDVKVITIEHDVYRGYEYSERYMQRDFLIKKGFVLVCGDVTFTQSETNLEMAYEDWWVKSDYVDMVKGISGNNKNKDILYNKMYDILNKK